MQATAILLMGLLTAAPDADVAPADDHFTVERAARQLRIQAYQTYRSDRETYDRLVAASDQLLSNWRHSGMPYERRHEVLGWFLNAEASELNAELPPLPELPVFESELVDLNLLDLGNDPIFESRGVTPLSIDWQQGPELAPADATIGTSEPAGDARPPLAERWADSPRAIITLGEFAFGVAGF